MITTSDIESSIKEFAKNSDFTFRIISTKYKHKISGTKGILKEVYEVETNDPTIVNEYSKFTNLEFIYHNI